MSDLIFGGYKFRLSAGKRACVVTPRGESPIAECVLTGQNKISRDGKHIPTAEGAAFRYVGKTLSENRLEIIQESETLQSAVVFETFDDCDTVRVHQEIVNRTDREVGVGQVSSFVFYGIVGDSISDLKRTHLYRFCNSWHCECQPRRMSLFEAGLYSSGHASFRRVYGVNKGSWSTKEELPQAIVEHNRGKGFTMFAVESPADWYWEFGECEQGVYLYTGGADAWEHEWEVRLRPGERYSTPATAVCRGASLDDAVAQMTRYRRHRIASYPADETLPVIFNDYMHLSWDSPLESRTREIAPVAAGLGADIYVIDCGWHNEEDGSVIYPYVGQWKESKKRFPGGIRQMIEYIHGLGMKAGLWLEPEIVGELCKEMTDFYPQDAWFFRDGVPVIVGGRRFLDYRCAEVRCYMDAVVDRLVGDYRADYLKFDYNQDCGSGTDAYGEKPGRGMELAAAAFFDWVKGVRKRYPSLIIEGCASGGQRLDYYSTAAWALVSSSDQTDYKKYPWIAANIGAAVLPEQAGVWSYPVDSWVKGFAPTAEWVRENVSDEQVIMNMINAMLGRMHLSSHLELLGARQKALVREGVEYMKTLSPVKRRAVPCFPRGFARFGDGCAASGLLDGKKLYLAVWNLGGGGRTVTVDLSAYAPVSDCRQAYPRAADTDFCVAGATLQVTFPKKTSARIFEVSFGTK